MAKFTKKRRDDFQYRRRPLWEAAIREFCINTKNPAIDNWVSSGYVRPMTREEYKGFVITQQRSFGVLRLLTWTEESELLIVTKDGTDVMYPATFATARDAKQAIDLREGVFERVHHALSKPD